MTHPRPDSAAGEEVPAPLVRAELDRILGTELFARSSRLSSFLKFIVEKTLAGEGESLKEHVIAVELYGKSTDFNTAEDPIVRIDARRLRDRLREYYADTRDGSVIISVPKGSYTPVFLGTGVPAATSAEARVPARSWIVGAAIVLLAAAILWLAVLRIGDRPEPGRLQTVTSLPGSEEDPSFSPDGRFVAFSWTGPPPSTKSDIWIKSVDGEAMRNLTNTPDLDEKWPQWSPDGQWIAFSRALKDGPVVVKVSALGGPEQTIAENAFDAAWMPDARGLVMKWMGADRRPTLMYQILDTGVRRPIVRTPPGFADVHSRISPDGRTLAFVRAGGGRSAVFLVPMAGGEPALFGEWSAGTVGGIEWMPDGREILAARPTASLRRVTRTPVGARGPDLPLLGIPDDAAGLSVARVGARYRLAVASGQPDVGVRLVDLQSPLRAGTITADAPFCDSTRVDMPGQFSPDGSQVAFTSNRSRGWQVWVANRDGSGLRPVTQFQNAAMRGASWSPDGRRLVVAAMIGDRADVSIVPVDGGPIRRVAVGVADAIDPIWSKASRWIYFATTHTDRSGIWKIGADGNGLTRLTSELGFDPRESPDGRSVYFIDQARLAGLGDRRPVKRVPVDGGPVEIVDVAVMPGAWDVTDTGIVFIADVVQAVADSSRGANTLQAYDFTDHRVRTIGQLAFVVAPSGTSRFLTVSRDGRWALVSHIDRWERDIFVLDGFR
jgi:Tol biopolymer transport system component